MAPMVAVSAVELVIVAVVGLLVLGLPAAAIAFVLDRARKDRDGPPKG